jgi:ribonuclease E
MKKIVRLTVFVIILAGLAVGTSLAFADSAPSGLKTDQRSSSSSMTAELNASSIQEASTSGLAASSSVKAELRGSASEKEASAGSSASSASSSSSSSASSSDDETEIVGVVESLTSDAIVISGAAIAISSDTEIDDEVSVGDTVKVEAFTASDGTLTAREIELFENDDDMDDQGDDDDDFDDDSNDDDFDDDSDDDDSEDDDSEDDDSDDED